MDKHEQTAYDLGVEHARNVASWVIDGNTPQEHVARMVAMLDDGDDLENYLPRRPNLSGEYADDLNPLRLATEILGDDVDPDPLIDDLCDAYEAGVAETFEPECERILRAALVTS